jgi:transcriptional regulator with XRE-family HTH domain
MSHLGGGLVDKSTLILIRRVLQLMREKDMTQMELSKKSGLSRPMISRYLTGKTVPSLANIDALAKALSVEPWELLIETKKRSAMNFWEAVVTVRDIFDRLRAGELPPEVRDLDSLERIARSRGVLVEGPEPELPKSKSHTRKKK